MNQKAPTTQTYLSIAGSTIPAWRSLLEQEYGRTLKSLTTLQGGTPPAPMADPPLPPTGAEDVMQTHAPEVALSAPTPTLEELREAVQEFGRESPSESTADEAEASENERDPSEGEATTEMNTESDKFFDMPEE